MQGKGDKPSGNGGDGEPKIAPGAKRPRKPAPAVRWDDTKMITNFANVVNIQSTREQVDLFFGTNQTWNMSDEKQLTVELNSRIILTPHAAKRLCLALTGAVRDYEERHGPLNVEP
jgi:hypothetical protein